MEIFTVEKARREAKKQAEYARIDYRHRLMDQPVEVESQRDRELRELAETEAEHAIARQTRKAERERRLRDQRAHELALV